MELQDIIEVMEHALSGISKIDAHGCYLYVNKAYAEMVGYRPEEMIGMAWQQTVHSDDLEYLKLAYQQMVQDGKVEVEARGLRKDGSSFYKQVVMISTYNQRHQFNGYYCFAKDISDRKQAEIALQDSQARFAGILEIARDAIIAINAAQQITLFNRGAERIFGYSSEEVLGQPLALLIPSRFTQSHQQHVQHYAESTGKTRQMGERGIVFGRRKDGTEFPAEASISKLTLNGEMIFTTFLRDISDSQQKEFALQRAIEAAEAANLAKSMFLANMSHELRTPLNVILGFAQLMAQDSSLTQSQRDDLQTIRRSGDHLLSLINDILDLSKIEAGHTSVENTAFDLIALLHSLRTMLAERATSKGIHLDYTIAPEVPQFVIADEQKIRQVLLNLLSNAIKFTHQGHIRCQVSIQEESQPVPQRSSPNLVFLQIQVMDTGAGIAPEELELIFDAFVQAQAGKQSTSGTGLGLTISRKLLELMGGDISVDSIVGQGSTFSFVLPVQPTSGTKIQSGQDTQTVIGLAFGQPQHRILIVDDEADNRRLMVRLLAPLDLEVYEATNGQDAVHICQQWCPDLIWMDIRMPIMDGYAATRQIRSQESSSPVPIIIALTAQASRSDRGLALAAGCNDYISKPFQKETVYLKLAEHLGLKYRYAEPLTSGDLQPAPTHANPDQLNEAKSTVASLSDLTTLPANWLNDLEKAAVCGNDRAIVAVAKKFPPELAQLAALLTGMADQYQFEHILQLIQNHIPG